ncbi:MAG: CDP-glycerol glycerophosphotransferase family protein [Erysipelotrichaceae bacterium]|nr:CDP-glycerol glycerophosphotransferase family protein [Erysipelotrichaceae bacterium]
MDSRLVNLIKYSKAIYSVYYYAMNTVFNGMKLFEKTDEKLILFNSFAGRKYDDSPKAIFDLMKEDERFKDYKLVWALHHPEAYETDGAEKIKTDTPEYFKYALRARVWVSNSSFERGLHFKNRNTFFLNTWHGTPIKKMGSDIEHNRSFGAKTMDTIDVMMAQSDFDADVFSRSFGIPKESFLKAGLPRNDQLANYTEADRDEFRKKLGIPEGKKVILYCPTFREYDKDENGVILRMPMDLKKWQEKLGNEYVLLFRAHYEVAKAMGIEENEFVRNMTDYPSLNELMIASDLLISDYSSIFIDYSIMDKPMLHYTYDYDQYASLRGMYFDIRDYISGDDDEDALIDLILNLQFNKEVKKTGIFRNTYVQYYGNAAKAAVECIAENLGLQGDLL